MELLNMPPISYDEMKFIVVMSLLVMCQVLLLDSCLDCGWATRLGNTRACNHYMKGISVVVVT